MNKEAQELTPRELAVMKEFWDHGPMTADEARVRLAEAGERLSYPTVANVVRGLVEKKFLKATNRQRPFTYKPTRTFDAVSQRMVGDLVARLFSGSRQEMLVKLLGTRKLSAAERRFLQQVLDEQEC